MDEIKEIENLIDNEIEELNKTVDTFDEVQFIQDDLKELIKASSLKDLLLELDKRINEHSKSNYLFNKYLTLYYLLESSYTLNPLFESIERIKNKNKVIEQATNIIIFNKELKKACIKLRKNKFSFKEDFCDIYDMTVKHVKEEEARVFIYSLCRLINSNGNKFISTYSLFINQLMKNITLLNESFDYKEDLLESIEMYYKEINN